MSERYEVHVDSYTAPIAVEKPGLQLAKGVTAESVRAELEERHYIAIPPRRSIYRTPELSLKRELLMRMVYRGEISIDLFVGGAFDGESGLIFFNVKPDIGAA